MTATQVLGMIGLTLLGVALFALLAAGVWFLLIRSLPFMARQVKHSMDEIDKELSQPKSKKP